MTPTEGPMPSELIEMVSERFKALSEPTRLHLLDCLRRGERTVSDLAEETGLHPANVSKHLQTLHQAGFVSRRKEGLFVHYRLADGTVMELCDLMCGKLDRDVDSWKHALER